MSQPFLSIVTRCCRRPGQLLRCIRTVQAQTSRDWEIILLVDRTGRHDNPVLWANRRLTACRSYPSGRYVYTLDDDGQLVDKRLIGGAMEVAEGNPGAILVKVEALGLDGRRYTWPENKCWNLQWEKGQRPRGREWKGTGYNLITRADVWRRCVGAYDYAPGGDWFFAQAVFKLRVPIVRLDIVASKGEGRGCGVLFEKCKRDWFERLELGAECLNEKENVWRLIGQ